MRRARPGLDDPAFVAVQCVEAALADAARGYAAHPLGAPGLGDIPLNQPAALR